MLIPPIIRAQDAYNGGLYSLWMALESLTGQNDQLGDKIKLAARLFTGDMGGIFHYESMHRLIEYTGYNHKYTAIKVGFHDQASFQAALNTHPADPILMAYKFAVPDQQGIPAAPDEAAAVAHWSVLVKLDPKGSYIQLANPYGHYDQIAVGDIVRNNLELDGGRFDWKVFVRNQGNSVLFGGQTTRFKNDPIELQRRGKVTIHLSGYIIAIRTV